MVNVWNKKKIIYITTKHYSNIINSLKTLKYGI